jgi:hypothetical protein
MTGRAVMWALIGEAIAFVTSALGLSVPELLLWSTVATVVTAIVGSTQL